MFYPLIGIPVILQLVCALHAYRNGKTQWIYIILFFPLVGCLLYFIVEIIPDLKHTARQVGAETEKVILPQAQLRRLQEELSACDSVANRVALAEAYMQRNQYPQALDLLKVYERGMYADDGNIQAQLALCYHMTKQPQKALEPLSRIRKPDGHFDSQNYQLLYALVLEQLGRAEELRREYEGMIKSFVGEEAKVRYGLWLKRNGELGRAREIFQAVLDKYKRAPDFYRRENRRWFDQARQELSVLK